MHAPSATTPARRLRRALLWLVALAVLAWAAGWAWNQPFMQTPRMLWRVTRMPPAQALPVPVEGVRATRIAATFGAPRGRDRTHAGVDIFAARGTPVRSATPGVIVSIRDGGLGGRQVWVLGPGRERYYYAHLDDWAPGLCEGRSVLPGDLLGFVGTTGNARGTPPHLHYGIYGAEGARDPLPALRAWRPPEH
ncbi:M23 family metallopeptidase [Pseudoxanthomonas winnipegensis]|jgi:murein DD-endopeptidase MepM/ murein hydrolase activator NlpD|uniref:M23 family metallopeptidase n=1 Tax=Pseudoxanthomonas winnipegensis TaxID=2480810 RepID=A0ABY1WGL2_9GAMM|nr:M23 family metallopeptidase [Pseudoxanthomonas winnipegensis]TAA08091.1 M23 family metallopeptidase [Pseudoxanthomonas winnipegensis]TAA21083.1 M23 family metallopeptidase [Pseudoxanthomonas winnipegensis]TAH72553.1 M23 family metallopeptidase [Pseudoxanthomonas winnipegensis]